MLENFSILYLLSVEDILKALWKIKLKISISLFRSFLFNWKFEILKNIQMENVDWYLIQNPDTKEISGSRVYIKLI